MASFTIINPNKDNLDDDQSDEDETLNLKNFQMYKNRPEWSDLKPVPQNDGPYKVVSIRYSPEYEDTFNYFRGVMAVEEISERAFELTEDCIKFNATNYTVWHYRRILLEKLNKNLIEEIHYTNKAILKNPKNYQVWEHQKFLLRKIKEKINQKQIENLSLDEVINIFKSFITQILRFSDVKNYHAWQQRQWFIKDYNCYDGELKFTEEILNDDVRNNSAWSHRYYVIQNTTGFTDEIIHRECQFAMNIVKLTPHNESSWNYLLGVLKQSKQNIDSFQWLLDICNELYDKKENEEKPKRTSPHLIYFMFKFLCLQMKNMSKDSDQFKESYSKAKNYCKELAEKADPIRVNYWNYQVEQLEKMFTE